MWHSKLLALQTCWTDVNFLSTGIVQSSRPTLYRWVGGERSKGTTDPQRAKTCKAFVFPSPILTGYFAAHPCRVWEIRWPGDWQWEYSWIMQGQLKTRTKLAVPGAEGWMAFSPGSYLCHHAFPLLSLNWGSQTPAHQLHIGRGLVWKRDLAKILAGSPVLLVTLCGAAAVSLNSFPPLSQFVSRGVTPIPWVWRETVRYCMGMLLSSNIYTCKVLHAGVWGWLGGGVYWCLLPCWPRLCVTLSMPFLVVWQAKLLHVHLFPAISKVI